MQGMSATVSFGGFFNCRIVIFLCHISRFSFCVMSNESYGAKLTGSKIVRVIYLLGFFHLFERFWSCCFGRKKACHLNFILALSKELKRTELKSKSIF